MGKGRRNKRRRKVKKIVRRAEMAKWPPRPKWKPPDNSGTGEGMTGKSMER